MRAVKDSSGSVLIPFLPSEAPCQHCPMVLVRLPENICVSLCILDFKIKERKRLKVNPVWL